MYFDSSSGTRARVQGVGLWNSTGIAQIGLLKDGCKTDMNISQLFISNATVEVHFANGIDANGYYFITSPADSSADVDQWAVYSSGDSGRTWKQVRAGFQESIFSPVSF